MDADRWESTVGDGFLGLIWVFNYREHYLMGAEIEGFLGPIHGNLQGIWDTSDVFIIEELICYVAHNIIFLLGGYFYHTSYDTVEKLFYTLYLLVCIQAHGDNMFNITKAFTILAKPYEGDQAIFFDYLTWFMVCNKPLDLLMINLLFDWHLIESSTLRSWFATSFDFIKGLLFHSIGVILAIIFLVSFAILRFLFVSNAMNWFSHPYLVDMMFVPCALVGLLIPRIVWNCFPHSRDVSVLYDEASFWGAFGLCAILTVAYLVVGLSGGFLTFMLSVSILLSVVFHVIPQISCLAYGVYFSWFIIEPLVRFWSTVGLTLTLFFVLATQLNYTHLRFFIPDVVVATTIGVVIWWYVGPLILVCGCWLARPSIMQFLLHLTVLGLALSSQFFPYTTAVPKRVIFSIPPMKNVLRKVSVTTYLGSLYRSHKNIQSEIRSLTVFEVWIFMYIVLTFALLLTFYFLCGKPSLFVYVAFVYHVRFCFIIECLTIPYNISAECLFIQVWIEIKNINKKGWTIFITHSLVKTYIF
ncbi:hypothetical protein UlMin_045761 [Ulmus minor]